MVLKHQHGLVYEEIKILGSIYIPLVQRVINSTVRRVSQSGRSQHLDTSQIMN